MITWDTLAAVSHNQSSLAKHKTFIRGKLELNLASWTPTTVDTSQKVNWMIGNVSSHTMMLVRRWNGCSDLIRIPGRQGSYLSSYFTSYLASRLSPGNFSTADKKIVLNPRSTAQRKFNSCLEKLKSTNELFDTVHFRWKRRRRLLTNSMLTKTAKFPTQSSSSSWSTRSKMWRIK